MFTMDKYGIESSGGFDLMSITRSPLICVWHILKYSLRIWNGKMKEHDLEKIGIRRGYNNCGEWFRSYMLKDPVPIILLSLTFPP